MSTGEPTPEEFVASVAETPTGGSYPIVAAQGAAGSRVFWRAAIAYHALWALVGAGMVLLMAAIFVPPIRPASMEPAIELVIAQANALPVFGVLFETGVLWVFHGFGGLVLLLGSLGEIHLARWKLNADQLVAIRVDGRRHVVPLAYLEKIADVETGEESVTDGESP